LFGEFTEGQEESRRVVLYFQKPGTINKQHNTLKRITESQTIDKCDKERGRSWWVSSKYNTQGRFGQEPVNTLTGSGILVEENVTRGRGRSLGLIKSQ